MKVKDLTSGSQNGWTNTRVISVFSDRTLESLFIR